MSSSSSSNTPPPPPLPSYPSWPLTSVDCVNSSLPVCQGTSVDEKTIELHTQPPFIPISKLDVKAAFDSLTEREKLYTHHLSQASWLGSQICFEQTSVESPLIFQLLIRVFKQTFQHDHSQTAAETFLTTFKQAVFAQPVIDAAHVTTQHPTLAALVTSTHTNITEQDFNQFVYYASHFFGNQGNYLSFGDSKFIPRLDKVKFAKICLVSSAPTGLSQQVHLDHICSLLTRCLDSIYSLNSHNLILSFPEQGISTYYTPNVTKADMSS